MRRSRFPRSRLSKPRNAPATPPPMVIAVDGPSGAGKSTASRRLAHQLGWGVFETGGLYRAVAWALLDAAINPSDQRGVEQFCQRFVLRLIPVRSSKKSGTARTWRIRVDGRSFSDELRDERISRAASLVAAIPAVRAKLLHCQRELLHQGRVVMEGRDIGTVICPTAAVKFFLDADPSVRGRRRFQEGGAAGPSPHGTTVSIRERDQRDQARAVAPLRVAADAVCIDTTSLTLGEVVDKMMAVLVTRGIFSTFSRLRPRHATRPARPSPRVSR